MSRALRKAIAEESVKILQEGGYLLPSQTRVSLQPALQESIEKTKLYRPEDFPGMEEETKHLLESRKRETLFSVVNSTTLNQAKILVESGVEKILALNFASAKNPGGGFLNGSQAQEESLSRASGLYASIQPQQEMYLFNRKSGTCLYSDYMIYSPLVPVFRDDQDQLLEKPYLLSFLTSPAVNAGAVKKNEPHRVGEIHAVMESRMEKVLTICLREGYENLILGAWGCGVFENDPEKVALGFSKFLTESGSFSQAFSRIIFAILDRSKEGKNLRPFEKVFLSK